MDMPVVTDVQISNYYCVKFQILPHLTGFEIMESVANIIKPQFITALIPNHEEAIVGVYVNNLESFCLLLQEGITVQGYHMCSVPMIGAYTASNIFPMVSNDVLTELFRIYGDIIEVQYVKTFPNKDVFDHIISDKRRLYFRIPGYHSMVCIPENVKAKIENVSINVKIEHYCLICSSDGHYILHCEDLRDFMYDSKISYLHKSCAKPITDPYSYTVKLSTSLSLNGNKTSLVQNVTEKNEHDLPRIQLDENASNFLRNNFTEKKVKQKVPINGYATSLPRKSLEVEEENELKQKIREVKNNENANNLSKNFLEGGKELDLLGHEIPKNQIYENSPSEKVYISQISPSMPDIAKAQFCSSSSVTKYLTSDDDMPVLRSSFTINNDF